MTSANPPLPSPGLPEPALWPERQQARLHEELHARPPLAVRAPSVISYWVHWQMSPAHAEHTLAALCTRVGQPGPQAGARHHVLKVAAQPGQAAWALKFERHGEFISWQMCQPLQQLGSEAPDYPTLRSLVLEASACHLLPPEFVAALTGPDTGQMISAAHIVLLPADDHSVGHCRQLLDTPDSDERTPLIGSHVADGAGTVFTRLALGADGFTRFVLLDHGLTLDQAARAVQRLCEIEAYRMLAMLGFPVAQQEAGALATLEDSLQDIVDDMANKRPQTCRDASGSPGGALEPGDGPAPAGEYGHDDTSALVALTKLAAEVEHSASRTRYRFSATRAYHAIVEDRVNGLREQRIPGVRTLGGFLGRRFEPAMALCASTDRRLTDVAERINRALSLSRVRVELTREANNQALLQSLVRRQHLQLRLQQTVEGLSVVAISYYTLSLVGYLAKAAKTLPLLEPYHLQPDVVVGLAVVPVVAGVSWFIERIKHHIED